MNVLKFMLVLLGFFTIAGSLLVVIVGTIAIINYEIYEMTGIDFAKRIVRRM